MGQAVSRGYRCNPEYVDEYGWRWTCHKTKVVVVVNNDTKSKRYKPKKRMIAMPYTQGTSYSEVGKKCDCRKTARDRNMEHDKPPSEENSKKGNTDADDNMTADNDKIADVDKPADDNKSDQQVTGETLFRTMIVQPDAETALPATAVVPRVVVAPNDIRGRRIRPTRRDSIAIDWVWP